MRLEEVRSGQRLDGLVPGESVRVLHVALLGSAAEVTYQTQSGLGQCVVYPAQAATLRESDAAGRPFDADGLDFRMVAEAQRIMLAGLYDPMLAVATSEIQPLPHQLKAVYEDLLGGRPLRFLLADDPGAGKTIMAGLYIKELILRDDVKRCLIVAPGGLVEQWQDELYYKFGLDFELLTASRAEAALSTNVFDKYPLLIARMDQLSRNDDLLADAAASEWDLVIVDEAHRMGAHYYGNKVEKTGRFRLGELLGQRTRHLLLMTATPHSGKEEDFQLFLTLLDRDMYEGKYDHSTPAIDTRGTMRRRVKEELLTFDGTPLFPDRQADTVAYQLSPDEHDLYEQVSEYVRHEMNRQVRARLQGHQRRSARAPRRHRWSEAHGTA